MNSVAPDTESCRLERQQRNCCQLVTSWLARPNQDTLVHSRDGDHLAVVAEVYVKHRTGVTDEPQDLLSGFRFRKNHTTTATHKS